MRHTHRIPALLAAVLLALVLAACGQGAGSGSSAPDKTITLGIQRDDDLSVGVRTADGYDLSQQGENFLVTKDGQVVTHGYLMLQTDYDAYVSAHKDSDTYSEQTAGGNKVVYYEDDGTYDYLVSIDGSKTFVYLVNGTSKDSADGALQALSFARAS